LISLDSGVAARLDGGVTMTSPVMPRSAKARWEIDGGG
jgi:hypothetical protein